MSVIVRQATWDDREALGRFLERAFPSQHRYPERWEWLYTRNPFLPSDFGVPGWIAVRDGHIIGHTGAMPVSVTLGGHTTLAAWSVDTFVLPEARGGGVGKQLQTANQHAHRLFMSLEMSAANRAIKKKLGAADGPAVSLFYRPLRVLTRQLAADGILGLQSRAGRVGRLIGQAAYAGAWQLAGRHLCRRIARRTPARPPAALPSLSLLPITGRFDETADALWARVRGQYAFAVERSSRYLNWKYREQPFMPHQCCYVMDGDEIEGLLVLREGYPPGEPPLGVISECFLVHPTATRYAYLTQLATDLLASRGVAGIWAATADALVEEAYAGLGFCRLRREPMVMAGADGAPAGIESGPALLSKGDHDWDQYPNLRQPYLRQLVELAYGKEGRSA